MDKLKNYAMVIESNHFKSIQATLQSTKANKSIKSLYFSYINQRKFIKNLQVSKMMKCNQSTIAYAFLRFFINLVNDLKFHMLE